VQLKDRPKISEFMGNNNADEMTILSAIQRGAGPSFVAKIAR